MPVRSHPLPSPLAPLTAALTAVAALCLAAPAVAAPAKAKAPAAVRGDNAPDVVQYGRREDVLAFAQQVSERHQLPTDWAATQLATARYLPRVVHRT
ncbi:MAG: hypothetical protein C4K60_17150 [Ideonella sp. MAG2]|nr:MAG: hypothetical protein C4K60_17150 [Ideonella sp. MAG2]